MCGLSGNDILVLMFLLPVSIFVWIALFLWIKEIIKGGF